MNQIDQGVQRREQKKLVCGQSWWRGGEVNGVEWEGVREDGVGERMVGGVVFNEFVVDEVTNYAFESE